MKICCEVIRDLLPLYAENVTCRESNILVEGHLEECDACRAQLAQMRAPVNVQADTDAGEILRFKKNWQKKTARITAIALLSAVTLFASIVFLYRLELPVSYRDVQIWTEHTVTQEGQRCFSVSLKGSSLRLVDVSANDAFGKDYAKAHWKVVRTSFVENLVSQWFGERTLAAAVPMYWEDMEDFESEIILEFSDRTVVYRNGVLVGGGE